MAASKPDDVISHWHQPYAEFNTPVQDFYELVQAGIAKHEIPGLKFSKVSYREGGVHTARREYLRVTRDRLMFDICAAPFGRGFFFSWWLSERRHRFAWLVLLLIIAVSLILIRAVMLASTHLYSSPFQRVTPWGPHGGLWDILVLGVRIVFFCIFLILLGRYGGSYIEDGVLSLPIIGGLYGRLFKRMTFHRIDTALAYQSMVHGTITLVIDGLVTAKGQRSMTDEEKKPIMRDFLGR